MHLIPFLLLLLFSVLHSLLAAEKFKNALITRIPALKYSYRVLYNLIALGLYLPALGLQLADPGTLMVKESFALRVPAILLMVLGSWGICKAIMSYDAGEFIGWRIPAGKPQLQISGWNEKVRHPLYTALSVGLLGFLLYHPSAEQLLFVGIQGLYLGIGIRLEEAKLLALFGKEYADYRASVPMLIPRLIRQAR